MKKSILPILIGIGMGALSTHAQSRTEQTIKQDTLQSVEYQTHATAKYGLRTNVLSLITLAPHLEFDFFIKKHWNISAGGAYGWWGFTGDQHAVQTWKVAAESRYYFNSYKFTGSALGLRFESGQFDIRLSDNGRRGKLTTLGLTYAYTWSLGKKHLWYIDTGLGGGYIYTNYTKYLPYKPTQCYHRLYDKKKHTFGLTNVFINIGYRFPIEKEGGIR